MRFKNYMVPVGFIISLLILILTCLELLTKVFGDIIIEIRPIVLFLFSLYVAYWLLKTQTFMENELEKWCKEKAPDLYRKYHDSIPCLKKIRGIYIFKLRKNLFIPSIEVRKSIFEQILQIEMNKLSPKKTVAPKTTTTTISQKTNPSKSTIEKTENGNQVKPQ